MQDEVQKIKIEIKESDAGDYGVSCIDLDGTLPQEAFGGDRVHLNREKEFQMCKRMLEWVNVTVIV